MTSRESTSGLIAAILVLLIFPILYVGSYFALVEKRIDVGPTLAPNYGCVDCEAVRMVYRPVHELDRRARPKQWNAIIIFLCPSH
jgi:hypothetical protein